jgi:hypothetical protein
VQLILDEASVDCVVPGSTVVFTYKISSGEGIEDSDMISVRDIAATSDASDVFEFVSQSLPPDDEGQIRNNACCSGRVSIVLPPYGGME